MDFRTFSFRHADLVLSGTDYAPYFSEIAEAIQSVTDAQIISHFEAMPRQAKSISQSINHLLKEEFKARGWHYEAPIFQDAEFQEAAWYLDFSKGPISIEVAFNHGEATAWNLIKPVLASEVNHVKKRHPTEIGVVICATDEMLVAGNFDGAVGGFEKIKTYFVPLQNLLTAPILLVGLEAPKTFAIENEAIRSGNSVKNLGHVKMIEVV